MNISGVHEVIYMFLVVSKQDPTDVVMEIHVKINQMVVTSNPSKHFRCNLSVTYNT